MNVRNEDGSHHCFECGRLPARVHLSSRVLCGVCWHRFVVARDLAQRIARRP